MQTGLLNIYIRSGDTYAITLTISSADPSDRFRPGTPIDLTGCQAEMEIASLYNVTPAYLLNSESATGNGGTITLGGLAGTVAISIPANDTLNLANGSYDLKIKFSDGSIQTFLTGSIFVDLEITQWT